jgi:predicted cupin superfamily sugar epimerase
MAELSDRRITIQELIDMLELEPLEMDGGLFVQTYCSPETLDLSVLPDRYTESKPFGTAIYYLLTQEPDSFSALHRLPTDEIYHFYLGDPIQVSLIDSKGSLRQITMGQDLLGGQQVQFVAPRGVWQGSRLAEGGQWGLMGTTMAPGFTYSDYEGARAEELSARFPQHRELIEQLTRSEA